jgi:hypothetical protein
MKKIKILLSTVGLSLVMAATGATAAPILLEGMGIQKQWTDTEAARDEMPDFVWGNSDVALANSMGLHVLFNDGTEGSIAYSGVSSNWNTSGPTFGTLISATGFFSNYAAAGMHFLSNSVKTNTVPGILPIAWASNPATPFGNNVELDYTDNAVNSQFRVTTAGWTSVEITTYSSSAANVSEPMTLALLGLGLAGLGWSRRKKA